VAATTSAEDGVVDEVTEGPSGAEDPVRPELSELRRRRALTDDAARADAVARRHAAGGRTARENLADLLDVGSFLEYGRLATAAQERRSDAEALMARSPADGLIGGIGRINGELFGDASTCAALTYDYLVMAGTQGIRGHHKSDRLLSLVERLRLPTVFLTEGGGGRPSDTDYPVVSALDVRTFALWARLSGVVPRVAVVAGRCFAGNAILAGSADIVVATRDATIGVAGPAMLQAAGLGEHTPEDVGPAAELAEVGVVDVLVDDEAEAVAVTRRLVGYVQGPTPPGPAPDQTGLREVLPERERSPYDVRPIVTTLCDEGSVTFLRERFAPELVTALGRIEGRPVGVLANQTTHMAGSLTSPASDKAARFVQFCDAFGIPLVSLVDTPGILGGPQAERTGVVRHASRLLVAAGRMQVPLLGVVLRRGYGLGAQAMLGGSTHEPLLTVAWPGAHMGPMGLEGAVRLSMRRELEAITDPDEREARVRELTATYRDHVSALNVARAFEIDDVIDPAETRGVLATALAAAAGHEGFTGSGRPVDTW
jgi:acetyl-CoA carboxylase carboxyltransferase component